MYSLLSEQSIQTSDNSEKVQLQCSTTLLKTDYINPKVPKYEIEQEQTKTPGPVKF